MSREEYIDQYATEYARHEVEGIACVDYDIYRAFMAGVAFADSHQPDKPNDKHKNFIIENYANFGTKNILTMLAEQGCFIRESILNGIRQKYRLHRQLKKRRYDK